MSFDLNEINSTADAVELGRELIENGEDVVSVLRQLDNWRLYFSEAFSELYDEYPDSGW